MRSEDDFSLLNFVIEFGFRRRQNLTADTLTEF